MCRSLTSPVEALGAITLAELEAGAALQVRVDRKYVASAAQLAAVVDHLAPTHAALEIRGRRAFEYRTTYYDTAGLRAYRDHVRGVRRRYKVRCREYVDAGTAAFEVKVRGGRGTTVKHRMPYDPQLAGALTDAAVGFVADCLRDAYGARLDEPLLRSLAVRYRRMTLASLELGERITCDFDLSFASPAGSAGALVDGVAIVEVKSLRGRSRADHALRDLGLRPEEHLSKYCLGVATTRSDVRANLFRELLRRHFGAAPAPAGAAPRAGDAAR